jgi:translation initiation factor IF-3
LDAAAEKGMDLVEVSPNAEPPVCKIIDYGKYKYEKSKKKKEASKKQNNAKLKEMKFHPKTDTHDYNFKMKNVRKFLMKGDRVKVSVVFRGREIVHKDIGKDLLDRVHEDLSDIAQSEILCNMEGRAMVSSYIPDKVKLKALSE